MLFFIYLIALKWCLIKTKNYAQTKIGKCRGHMYGAVRCLDLNHWGGIESGGF